MVDASNVSGCWHCGRPPTNLRSCRRCGVWLSPLRAANVPAQLWSLLGVARRWGISDDSFRWNAVATARPAELESLVRTVDAVPADDLGAYLSGPDADEPSDEYVAITCLMLAADQASLRLTHR